MPDIICRDTIYWHLHGIDFVAMPMLMPMPRPMLLFKFDVTLLLLLICVHHVRRTALDDLRMCYQNEIRIKKGLIKK